MKRLFASVSLLLCFTSNAMAGPCEDRFAKLVVNGNAEQGPVRILIEQEIAGSAKTLNYHFSDGNHNGMTEMIDPVDMPWSLFIGDKMYSSNDKGKSWNFMNSYDAAKARSDAIAASTKDAADATGVTCGEGTVEGVTYELVQGSYKSSMSAGAAIDQKYWVDPKTGWIVKTWMHMKMPGFESTSTQVIEPWPDFVLPKPE